jgi:hypothetical protein
MARAWGSLVSTQLPIFARKRVGCANGGLVSGKTNTIYQWQTVPGLDDDPAALLVDANVSLKAWFHDLL